MARPSACHSSRWNPPFINKNELAGAALGPAPTEGSDTSTPAPVMSRVPIFALPDASVAAPSLALALTATTPSSDNELFKQFIKAYLKAQVPGQTKVDRKPRKQAFKAQFPNLYYGNSPMDYYQFCQQCEDYFETAGAKGPNRIPFAASFLHESVT